MEKLVDGEVMVVEMVECSYGGKGSGGEGRQAGEVEVEGTRELFEEWRWR